MTFLSSSLAMGRQQGLSAIEAMAATLGIVVVMGLLLDRLTYYQEMVEHLHMESTVRALVTGLQIRQAELVFAGKDAEIKRMDGMNPFTLLQPLPSDYLGECSQVPSAATGWCFRSERGESVYRPRSRRHLVGESPTFRVVCHGGQEKVAIVPVRASLQLLYSYEWLESKRPAGRW